MKKTKEKEAEFVSINCKIEKEYWKELKYFTIQNDETIAQTIRKALKAYLKKNFEQKKDVNTE